MSNKFKTFLFEMKIVGYILAVASIPAVITLIGCAAASTTEHTDTPIVEYRISLYNGGREVDHWSTTNKIITTDQLISFKDNDGYDVRIRAMNYSISRQR